MLWCQRMLEARSAAAPALTRAARAAASLAPAVLAEAAALPADQALALLLLPAIGQAHVLALPPPPGGAGAPGVCQSALGQRSCCLCLRALCVDLHAQAHPVARARTS